MKGGRASSSTDEEATAFVFPHQTNKLASVFDPSGEVGSLCSTTWLLGNGDEVRGGEGRQGQVGTKGWPDKRQKLAFVFDTLGCSGGG